MLTVFCLWLLLGHVPGPIAGPPEGAVPAFAGRSTPGDVRLVFVGDIMVHQEQLNIARGSDGYDFFPQLASVRPLLKGDALIGNLETVLGGPDRPYAGYPSFNTPDALADALDRAGFTALLLANNHILDRGTDAALRTARVLKETGFAVAGLDARSPDPLLLDVGGVRVGILNRTYGSNRPITPAMAERATLSVIDPVAMARDVMDLRGRGAQYLVAALHWGAEYRTLPDRSQRAAAFLCLAMGVDAVVGAHPHVLQPVEIHLEFGKPQFIAWSLGNFLSAQRTVPRERAMVLALELRRDPGGGPASLRRAAVAPTWVELSPARRVARVLPAAPASAPEGESGLPKRMLAAVDRDFRRFLDLSPRVGADGFYTVYAAPPSATDLLFGWTRFLTIPFRGSPAADLAAARWGGAIRRLLPTGKTFRRQ